jgi:hypothetical protein
MSDAIDLAAATITAASCNLGHVQTALNQAAAGDTVNIPAGTCLWTSSLTWTAPANVTIRGAGNLTALGGGDATVIVDNYASASPLITIAVSSSGTFRLAGLTIQGGSGSSKGNGVLIFDGPGRVRVDHNHFNTKTYNPLRGSTIPVWFGDGVVGVVDHNIADFYSLTAFYFFNGQGSNGQADGSWASATSFGTATTYLYLEDNLFRGHSSGPGRIGDSYNGSRVVWRFNTIQGMSGLELHATGHAGDGRGHRSQEGYRNHFMVLPGQDPPPFNLADIGSGTALVWGNTTETSALKHGISFNVTRKNNATYTQTAPSNGWGYCGNEFNGNRSNWDGNTSAALGYPCLDQPGRGIGDLLIGSFPMKTNSRTGNISWPNQALEPIYEWMNSVSLHPGFGPQRYRNDTLGRVVANRDYYPQASGSQTSSSSPFDGTAGTGWGTLARRPPTCTPGVGYFATDQGSWNTSTSNPNGVDFAGADGVLFKCTAPNTWTLYYTPYTYPHPLTSTVAPPRPSTPTNFRVTPGSF